MTTVPTELARHVADNPDGCDIDDLEKFINYVGQGDRPAPQAAAIWPNNEVEAIEGYSHQLEDNTNRVRVVVLIRDYCRRSVKARTLRSDGQVQRALELEKINDRIYDLLPAWARW